MALQNWYKAVVKYKYEGDDEWHTSTVIGHASSVGRAAERVDEKFTSDEYASYPKYILLSIEYLGWESF